MDRKTWARLGSAFSLVVLLSTPGELHGQTAADNETNLYLEGLNRYHGIRVKAGEISPQERTQVGTLREQYPGVDFVRLGHLEKYITLPVDHVSFDQTTKELTVTVLDYGRFESDLKGMFLNPLSSWPSHTVLTFNGFQVNDDTVCAFIPNTEVGDVKAVKIRRGAVNSDFSIDGDKSKTAPDRAAGEGLSIQQKVTITSTTLPTQLFDASKLTCVAVEMPRAGMLWNLATADNGQWVTLRSGATNAGEPSASDPPQPTQ
ncbi:MAG: hypothetical protein KDI65_12430 [Alphaproteobacteria bacterium]|nr:hypothetical protein [Alphaproteobacteria bacterium]